jgi:1,2-phenylacetyl-CoA epoxidase catalytic subunit
LVEQPNDDFAWVIARQFLHDVYAREIFTQQAIPKIQILLVSLKKF